MSWEGFAVTGAFLVGGVLSGLVHDLTRRSIVFALMTAAYCAVVFLTWSSDAD